MNTHTRNKIYKLIGHIYNFENKYNRSIYKISNVEGLQYYTILEICMQKALDKKYKYIEKELCVDKLSLDIRERIQSIFWFEILCMSI